MGWRAFELDANKTNNADKDNKDDNYEGEREEQWQGQERIKDKQEKWERDNPDFYTFLPILTL